jgi:death-on-curing protein
MAAIVYLSLEQVLQLHQTQLARYGGDTGLRDRGLIESALARPAATFGGEDLYADLLTKAAALMHSLVLNHPFVDGNKRVGAHAAIVFVTVNDWEFLATPDELVDMTLALAEGRVAVEALAIWFRHRLRAVD